ncbi:MAG: tyrosine-type recombinase/integrase [Hamadaea sp.]|nr:tyrosine-type recombinase/integrase [Hamadaea sp.]
MSNAIVPAALLGSLPPLERTAIGYLADYEGNTRALYESHFNRWLTWCREHGIDPLRIDRAHISLYVRELHEVRGLKASTVNTMFRPVKGFYRYAFLEGVTDRDPAVHVRLPKVDYGKKSPLEREELRAFRRAAKELGGRHWALSELLCLHGLRISEACSIDVDDYSDVERGHPILRVKRKGGKVVGLPLPVALLLALQDAAGDRTQGPLLTTRDGRRLHRSTAAGLVRTIAKRAGITRPINPHLIRASLITSQLDDGMTIRDAQWLAGHADPRTTSRHYDLGMSNHDKHPVHIVSARLTA